LTTGNANIDIGNQGVAGESGVIRLGTSGTQIQTFIAGIAGVTLSGGTQTVVVDGNAQLGAMANVSGGVTGVTASTPLVSSGGSTPNLTLGIVPIASGGTGAGDAATARTNLGLATVASTGNYVDLLNQPLFGTAAALGAGTGAGNVLQLTVAGQLPALDGSLLTNVSANTGSDGLSNTRGGSNALGTSPSGNENVAFGSDALRSDSTGSGNVAFGVSALTSNLAGGSNTALGVCALMQNTYSGLNIAIGPWALNTQSYANGNSIYNSSNIAIGSQSLTSTNPTSANNGMSNIGLGVNALLANTTGSYNIGIGQGAGYYVTTGSDNIDISNLAVANDSGTIRLGTAGHQMQTFIAGITGVTTGLSNAVPVMIDGNGQLGTINSSIRFKTDVQDMGGLSSRIFGLRPVTFRYKVQPGAVHVGLIAEEVEKVMPELVVRAKDGQIQTVAYQDLVPMLLNELQKLQAEKAGLEARLARIEKKLGLD
jgi:hypothetical protein